MKFLALIIIISSFILINCQEYSYDGYRLIRLLPKTTNQIELIQKWELKDSNFDVWNKIKDIKQGLLVLLSPNVFLKYISLFNSNKLNYEIVEENIQNKIEEQKSSMTNSTKRDANIVGKFARYADIMDFIDFSTLNNPNFASSKIIGQTYERRNLKIIILKTNSSKKNVWIDCGIHAREWISPATCIYMINKLITEYKAGIKSTVDLLNYYEFHILPLQNPDGYEFSHTNSRFWRKNRSPNAGSICLGTDLNRNWGYKWMTGGSSTDPCSDIYAGKSANSELETKAIQNYILSFPGRWDSFLTIHSFGQWWFTPWGWTKDLPSNYNDLLVKGKIGASAIQSVSGNSWLVGTPSRILYIASGGSHDWAFGFTGINYSYCLELRPGQSGVDSAYGFAIPADRIPKSGEETYQGIKAFLKSILPL